MIVYLTCADMSFSCFGKKRTKEADLRGGFLQRRPLLKISPPKPEKVLFQQFDAKVCRPSLYCALRPRKYCWRSGRGFQGGCDLLVSPLWLSSLVTFLFSDKKVTYRSPNNAVDKYRSPESGSSATMVLPLFSGRRANSFAAHNAAPAEIPTRTPWFLPNSRASS